MKLFFSKGACSLATRIVINEIGIKSEFEAVNLKTKKTATGQDYLTINPKGAVPAIDIGKGEILTENAVIQQYLADTNHATQLLPEVGNINRYHVLEWLNYVSTEIHKGFSPLFNSNVAQAEKDKIFIPNLLSKFKFVDKQLQSHAYLTGKNFTLPDAYLFVMIAWAGNFKFNLSEWPNVSRYFGELLQRPAIKKSLQEEGL